MAFAETAPFPAQVLRHHFPETPNHGDATQYADWPDYHPDIIVGGSPCQAFSVAGLRKGFADPRGNLTLTYLAILARYLPRWVVWENVPGVLSHDGGRTFGTFLGALGQLGYGWAYRVLDAQYIRVDSHTRAVPQRRRRVFVVGHLGDRHSAAQVLFEPQSLRGNPPPRRGPRQVAPTIAARSFRGGGLGTDFDCGGGLVCYGGNNTSGPIDVATACNAHGGGSGRLDFESETFVATHCLKSEGADASEDGSGRGVPLVVAFDCLAGGNTNFAIRENAASNLYGGGHAAIASQRYGVRRMTPLECERLQGFPDGWTAVPYRGKAAADGPRYKAIGNSMAVNVMSWIGQRIALVDDYTESGE